MSAENPPKFVHHFLPGEDAATVLLLHGTGGDENSLIPLGRELAPRAALLARVARSSKTAPLAFLDDSPRESSTTRTS